MDPRKILGVPQDATLEEIQRAYREKVAKHHPDMGGDVWAFQQVNDAYEALTNSGTGRSNFRNRHSSTDASQAGGPANRPVGKPQTRPEPKPAHSDSMKESQRAKSGASSKAGSKASKSNSSVEIHKVLRGHLPLQTETCVFIFVNVLDIYLTHIVLALGGIEANPVARFFLDLWGPKGLIWFKLFIVALVCLIAQIVATRRPQTARALLILGSVIVSCVVIYSVWLLWHKIF